MESPWKKSLIAKSESMGFELQDEPGGSTPGLKAMGVPYREDSGNRNKFNIHVARTAAGSNQAPDHQAEIENWTGKTVKVKVQGNAEEQVVEGGTRRISIHANNGEYEDVYHQMQVYIHHLTEGGGLGPSHQQKWESLVQEAKVNVIGAGGTGTWIVDILSKTNVGEIHVWDHDKIERRNVKRAPGGERAWAKHVGAAKAEACQAIYGSGNVRVIPHVKRVEEINVDAATTGSYLFIAVDDEESQELIEKHAISRRIRFSSVGMSVDYEHGTAKGSIHIRNQETERTGGGTKGGQNAYQVLCVPEAHAASAAMAVFQWRHYSGQIALDTGHNTASQWTYRMEWNTWLSK